MHIEMNELVELLKNNIMPLGVTNREIMEYLTKKRDNREIQNSNNTIKKPPCHD